MDKIAVITPEIKRMIGTFNPRPEVLRKQTDRDKQFVILYTLSVF